MRRVAVKRPNVVEVPVMNKTKRKPNISKSIDKRKLNHFNQNLSLKIESKKKPRHEHEHACNGTNHCWKIFRSNERNNSA